MFGDLGSSATLDIASTLFFALAVLHTFLVKWFQSLAKKFPHGSVGENLFHLLGEVEVVFGIWGALYILLSWTVRGGDETIAYLESRNFTEPAFVFVIMTICSTQPVLSAARQLISGISRGIPVAPGIAFFFTALFVGPLLGSFITEPAAMTVTALLLLENVYSRHISMKLKYAAIGALFVNVSIGGVLTPYAAPPVLMVAKDWGWDITFMMKTFGWRAVLACFAIAAGTAWSFRKELQLLKPVSGVKEEQQADHTELKIPAWVKILHLVFLVAVVMMSHHMVVFGALFLFFLGLASVTREYQREIKLREGLLVGFFLGGLVVLGGPQRWWLEPLLSSLNETPLYFGATALTAITDNAALTYLGAQVPTLSFASKIALVAGAVSGGGLTVIANAPNPAGYGILNRAFGDEGISPGKLFLAASLPTLIVIVAFWLL
jgi:hypothetical protein